MNLTNESSMWCSFVKNTFVDDGDIKLATNRFDRNTYCTVSMGNLCITVCGTNFLYNLIFFLRNWRMPVPHWPLNSRFSIYNRNHIKRYFAWEVRFKVLKLQTHFSQNILFIYCNIFSEIMVICLGLKHVSLGFKMHHHLRF